MNFRILLTATLLGVTMLRGVPANAANDVQFQLIRNATVKITYAGTTFLVDPMLGEKEAYPGFKGTVHSERRFPLQELPIPVSEVIEADAMILTHLHDDHWDIAARRLLPRTMPIFVQSDEDAARVRGDGFTDVRVIAEEGSEFKGTRLIRVRGQHGTDQMYAVAPVGKLLGDTMGVIFHRRGHATVFVAGDTVWNRRIDEALAKYQPDAVILNTGRAMLASFPGSILMDEQDFQKAYLALPRSKIVGIHMDTVNHATLSRAALRDFMRAQGLSAERALVPDDGQSYTFRAIVGR